MPIVHEAMTWSGYWVPHLTTWLLSALISGVFGTIVGLLVRRWVRQAFGQQNAKLFGDGDDGAPPMAESVEDMKRRFDDVFGAFLNQKALEQEQEKHAQRLKALERYAAAHETEQARQARITADTRLMPVQDATTTGGIRFRDIG